MVTGWHQPLKTQAQGCYVVRQGQVHRLACQPVHLALSSVRAARVVVAGAGSCRPDCRENRPSCSRPVLSGSGVIFSSIAKTSAHHHARGVTAQPGQWYYCRGGDFPTGRGEARWSVHLDPPAPGSPMDARHHRRSGSASCPHPSIIVRTANGSCRSLGMSTVRGGHGRDHRIGTGVVYRYCVTHAGPPAILASAFWRRDAGARLAAGRWPGGYSSRSSPPASSPSFSRGRGPWDGRLSLSSSLKDANVRLAEGVCDLPRSSLGTRAIGDQGHDLLRDPVER
jgi:hypothetical protein